MNTTSNNGLEDFRESPAPERFEVAAPSGNSLLPSTNASVSKGQDSSVELNWTDKAQPTSTLTSDMFFTGMKNSAQRKVERFPTSSRAHANFGIALLKNGQGHEALEELTTALRLDPRNYLAGITLAKLHFTEGRLFEARTLYEGLLGHHPKDAGLLLALSSIFIRLEDYERAHGFLLKAVEIDEKDFSSHLLLGMVCLKRSDLRCALNEFRAASRLDFRNPNIHHAIGVAYTLQNDHARAEKAFKTAYALAPNSSSIVIGLASTLLIFRKYDQACEMLLAYLEINAGDRPARELLARSYIEGKRYTLAKSQIRQLIQTAGIDISKEELSRHHSNLAVALMNEKDFKHAEVELKNAIKLAPDASHIPYDNLARVYALTNRGSLGISLLVAAVEMFPSSIDSRLILSILYSEREEYRRAISQLEQVRAEGKLPQSYYATLGSHYGEVLEFERAIAVLMEGYSKYPKSLGIINNLAYYLLELGEVSQAKEVLINRPMSSEPHAELMATLGLLRLHEGNYDAARRLYKQAELIASRSSQKNLARRVRQKMHLELARFHARSGDVTAAEREIRAGLLQKVDKRSFNRDLNRLRQSLSES